MRRAIPIFCLVLAYADSAGAQVLTQRVANTTLALPSSPGATTTNTYTTTNAFPGLTFALPVAIRSPPGETNRLFVVEKDGTIQVITNLSATPGKRLFMNIASRVNPTGEGGLLGLAFHPDYANNRYFYVYYTAAGTGFSNRVARFQTTATNSLMADTNSEVILIGQFDEASNHNGGDVHFGPDGYLYISLGDEGDSNDSRNNSQTLTKDFFAGLLRIDVDKKPGSVAPNHHPSIVAPTNYAIPPDNAFIGVTNFNGTNFPASSVRTEYYAIGLRNPWRFSFDYDTGRIYVGDVGQGAREEVDIVTNGGNYGWAYREGFIAGPKPTGNPTSHYASPILDYAHGSATNQGNSITGGIVYRGNRLPELVGRYIFCDYSIGNIWSVYYNGSIASNFQRLAADASIAGFGVDPQNGDVLMGDIGENLIKRLVRATGPTNALPQTLSGTGAFSDLPGLVPNAGLVAYDINVPFWSDGAGKQRWFSVPNTNLAVGFSREGNWSFPTGTVWVKHFDLELTSGVPSSIRRLETRLLVKNSSGASGYGITYRWGTSTTNAVLVPDEGLDEPFVINDGGTIRTQVWHYPGRSECLVCHQPGAGFALGFNTVQLNRDHNYGVVTDNQIRVLSNVGYFTTTVTNLHTLRRLAPAADTNWSLESRARSFVQANCTACHFPGGTAPGAFDARVFSPLSAAGFINGGLNDNKGDTNNRVIRPGVPANSMLLTRIAAPGAGRMPPLASTVLDTQSIALVTAWVNELAGYQGFADWQTNHFGSTNNPDAAADADPDQDGGVNFQEYLTGHDPTNDLDYWAIRIATTDGPPRVEFLQAANRGYEIHWTTNLLDSESWRALDVAANGPFFAASAVDTAIEDADTNAMSKFYRVRVYEP